MDNEAFRSPSTEEFVHQETAGGELGATARVAGLVGTGTGTGAGTGTGTGPGAGAGGSV